MNNEIPIPKLDFARTPLIPAIVQDDQSGEILMQAYLNEEAWRESLISGRTVFYSRSRKELWRKGATSGNVQIIKKVLVDCDLDSVIFRVEQVGKCACHTGNRTCFFRRVHNGELCEDDEK